MARAIATTWERCVLLEGDRVVREARVPSDPAALAERVRLRRAGRTTPEEEELLKSRGSEPWCTRDRRLVGPGVVYDPTAPLAPPERGDVLVLRPLLLEDAERALAEAWDPSVHLEEAVRAVRDLDRAANLVGERLASWASRDTPEIDASQAAKAAEVLLTRTGTVPFGPPDPSVEAARRRLAETYRALLRTRDELAAAIDSAVPVRTPNLAALLGADLAARMLAQAGSLERLARLPASTVQVLGAERAFFEHLRGRAPPPRHGLLFLHPALRSASRRDRGKLARSLAAKVAIAARLDHAGAAVDPALTRAFEARKEALRAARGSKGRRRPDRSAAPLDGAAQDGELRG